MRTHDTGSLQRTSVAGVLMVAFLYLPKDSSSSASSLQEVVVNMTKSLIYFLLFYFAQVLLGILQRRIQLDKEVLFQFTSIKRWGINSFEAHH